MQSKPLESMGQWQVKVQGSYRNNSMPNFQPRDLFQVWQNGDFLVVSMDELKVLELPKEESGTELE